jgi:hypothetical protein
MLCKGISRRGHDGEGTKLPVLTPARTERGE